MTIRSLNEVVSSDLCAGCGVCESICGRDAVQMQLDPRGFLRPVIKDAAAVPWAEVSRICPGAVLESDATEGATELEMLWGKVLVALRGFAADGEIRWRGSSGGALSAILTYLLESSQADYVSQMRLGQPDALGAYVQHSRNREDVLNCAGSLYLPTAPLVGVLDSLRDSGERMVFVGKPCDVAALRALLKVYPQVADRVVATISFFCAGVPSQSATLDLLDRLGVRREETTRFRYRGCGWPGRATATDANGQEHSLSYSDSWGQILSKHLQFRCKICPDGIGEFADIVCGDAWKTIDGYPDFDEKPGLSLILARTPRGAALLQGAQQAGFLEGADFDLSTLGAVQPFQKARRQGVAPRLLAMRLLGKPTPRFSGFHLAENARQAGAKRFALGVLGMSRRLLLVK